ncbi:capsular polysaccharide biosynthesis protein CapF [Salinicoccus roseus]|uniref:capsular polysaccharide biosynthesis protein CapF n=1 Tax=Salinicoccus roseus TaxID=45670 RepID=UPI00230089A1|nr:capsular polysaccharide biosynthesis protein CapF [Salinicoccus roseus]
MNILVTGAQGFIGKNLVADLKNDKNYAILELTRETNDETFDEYCKKADFVYHLAGVNRPKDDSEFMEGNYDLTAKLLENLRKHDNKAAVLITSSIQAEKDNPYGRSKKAEEEVAFKYSKGAGVKVLVYRLPNVFGKWCEPNYNSAIATFCHNIARDLPITVNNAKALMDLVYIDDVVAEFKKAFNGEENKVGQYCEVKTVYQVELGKIVDLLKGFRESRVNRSIPNMKDGFSKKLYSTYLSYLPENEFNYNLKMNVDNRGSFTEFIKTPERGQVSVNISKPGITKGNHWHHTKNEKFLVVSGSGVIKFRKINEDRVLEYHVSGEKLEVIDIPTGYAHNIENLGVTDMVTVMWANEIFDSENPDTYYEEV